jgi:hypothetical protein
MTKLTGAALDRAVAQAMGLKSVNNCEKWGKEMKDPEDEAFEELALKQGQWQHTSGWRKKQIMEQAFPNPHRTDMTGMTLRQYAAIKLKVPDSGTDWLDDMIRQSIKDDFAAMAMDAFLSRDGGTYEQDAECANKMADAMLKARETK